MELSSETDKASQGENIKYEIGNKVFIVEPLFSGEGKESLGHILLRLMQLDITNH